MMLSPVQICMDSTDWPQSMMQERMGFRPSAATANEDLLACSRPLLERGLKPQPEQALKCPRCESTNTKFCYYNNYSLSQPRHFCKTCRRYWTKGGALRTVPVGGGCRKNKKTKRAVVSDHSATLNEQSTSSANMTALSNPNPATNLANTNIFFNNSTNNTSGLRDINAAAAFARVQQQAALANCNTPGFLGLSCGPSNTQSSFGLTLNPINFSALNALHTLKSTFPSLVNDFPVLNSNKSTTEQGSSSSSLIPPSEWHLASESNLFAADSWSGGVWPDLTSYIGSSSSM